MFMTLGCDPEIYLRNKVTKDFVSAFGLFPGTKKEPYAVDKGAIQVDGMALEFNIHPATTMDEFTTNIETVLKQAKEMTEKIDKDLEFVFEPCVDIDPMYFALQPLDCKILGCDPDYDELGEQKTPPEGMQDLPFRTFSGHIHIGWRDGGDPYSITHFDDCKFLAKAFKNVPGYTPITPQEKRRSNFYGRPGSFRPKTYGVELRSPSNRWVATRKGREDMFKITYRTMIDLGNKDEVQYSSR